MDFFPEARGYIRTVWFTSFWPVLFQSTRPLIMAVNDTRPRFRVVKQKKKIAQKPTDVRTRSIRPPLRGYSSSGLSIRFFFTKNMRLVEPASEHRPSSVTRVVPSNPREKKQFSYGTRPTVNRRTFNVTRNVALLPSAQPNRSRFSSDFPNNLINLYFL